MIIALLGGTGNLGKGLAIRFAIAGYDVVVGSRDSKKAEEKALEYSEVCGLKIKGLNNVDALKICDVAILTIPWKQVTDFIVQLKDLFKNKIVVSPVVPMERINGVFVYTPPPEGSMAEKIASILKDSSVVSAYHNIPAKRFAKIDEKVDFDVIVCGDDIEAKNIVIDITNDVDGLRALDGGELSNSRVVESLTPFIINLSLKNKIREAGLKLV